jgi:hypothetical protein
MTDLSTAEQRKRAGVSPTGTHTLHRGRPTGPDEKRIVDGRFGIDETVTVVGDEERMDLPDHDAAERAQRWQEQRRAISQSARASRRHQPLHQRLKAVEEDVAQLQAPRARRIDPSQRTGGEQVLPPGGNDGEIAHAHEQDVRRLSRHIEKAVERLEDLLDAHHGRAPARDYATMDSWDKNAAILTEFVGWRPEEIVAFEPLFGTVRTIRYVREEWAGEPRNLWPGGGVRGVCGHREGHCTDECPPAKGGWTARRVTGQRA